MQRAAKPTGFALVVTLIMMAFIVGIAVAYLSNTRSDRSTSSVYANRLRAKMVADAALAAATKLLYENTKNGNYITAMPAQSPSPSTIWSEIYRPDDTSASDDFLKLNNAIGDVLASRTASGASPAPTAQVDARPAVTPMPAPAAGGSFGIPPPSLTTLNSYDFNPVVRIGGVDGRLVESAAPGPATARPAFGQWVRVRNSAGELIGRYAFFVEDESMKVNVAAAGNHLGPASSPNLRVDDMTTSSSPTPSSQVVEVDPSALLPATANRANAISKLIPPAPASREQLNTKATLALIDEWKISFPDYAHLITVLSQDDNTTAKGWQRLDINKVVATATSTAAKVAAANKLGNWIRDAWTGPGSMPASTEEVKLYGNQRLRQQVAANIVDYVDTDDAPTDMGDILPDGYTDPAYNVPVIGIEKIPYISSLFVTYEASNRVGNTASIRMRARFNFMNLFDTNVDVQKITRIELEGAPEIFKKGAKVFDHYDQTFSIPVSALKPVQGSGFTIAPAQDGVATAGAGARSFETDWLVPNEKVTFSTQSGLPTFSQGQVKVRVFGNDASGAEARLDVLAAETTDTPSTGYKRSGSSPSGDFLLDAAPGPLHVSAVYLLERVIPSTTTTQNFSDPRYRPTLLNEKWRRLNFSDDQALTDRLDLIDANPRIYAVDWYDYYLDRPLAFIRNGPLTSVGELGNVAASEYPWRTLYLQYPERPANAGTAAAAADVTTRRSSALDYVLMDLFATDSNTSRAGAININSATHTTSASEWALSPLFLGVPVGSQTFDQVRTDRVAKDSGSPLVSAVANRRSAVGPPPDNNPLRPYFTIGELAPVLSRLVNSSANSTSGSPARSTVTYSALRNSATSATEANTNIQRDILVEQPFRKISNSITTHGNVFRVLYVGQSIKDIRRNGTAASGIVDSPDEILSEYLGEAFVQRQGTFQPAGVNPDAMKTSDSKFKILAQRVITE